MHNAETRALQRAALLLVAVSAARWGWSSRPGGGAVGGDDVLADLSGAAREASVEDAQRRRPLAVDERIDPNVADVRELDRLAGVGPSTAAAIVTARDSGFVFRSAEDMLAVRGIGPSLLEKIRPQLDLTASPPTRSKRPRARSVGLARLDVNRATVEEFQQLPGVGPVIAERIVTARREQWFRSVDDLIRVPGIGPATLARIRTLVSVGRIP